MNRPLISPKNFPKQGTIPLSLSNSHVKQKMPNSTASLALPQKAPKLDASKLPSFTLRLKPRKHIHSIYCGHRPSEWDEHATIRGTDHVREVDPKQTKTQNMNAQNRENGSENLGSRSGKVGAYTDRIPNSSYSSLDIPSVGEKSIRTGKIRRALVSQNPSRRHLQAVSYAPS